MRFHKTFTKHYKSVKTIKEMYQTETDVNKVEYKKEPTQENLALQAHPIVLCQNRQPAETKIWRVFDSLLT